MPNLEHFRKQAKQVVRWHRERHWPVAEVIRNHLPEYSGFRDREVFDQPFRLHDAQQLVAKQAGYADWLELKQEAESAPAGDAAADSAGSPVRFERAVPFIFVSDIDRACDFFTRVLGFETSFRYGEPPFYAEVHRDSVHLSIRHVDAADLVTFGERRRAEELLAVTIVVDDVRRLYQSCLDAGASFFQKLRTEPYGARSFIVEDPDGNLIAFATPAEDAT